MSLDHTHTHTHTMAYFETNELLHLNTKFEVSMLQPIWKRKHILRMNNVNDMNYF